MTLPVLRAAILATVSDPAQPDLTARQMSVLLAIAMEPTPQTVRGMAAALNVQKPVISRALDRLAEFDLARRAVDPKDRRIERAMVVREAA